MKTSLFFLLFFTLVFNPLNAQTSASEAGIAVQGIARDNNNAARVSADIVLTFELYYRNTSNVEVPIYSETITLTTDAFGVFSHILDAGEANQPVIQQNHAFLRISEGVTIISNEILKHVPYAISANNGVPTGSIMPYMGATAPSGWVLCNGQSLTSIPGAENLISILGNNNAPNLNGMFLRGTGANPVNGQSGPGLGGVQGDQYRGHSHGVNINTNFTGNHSHTSNIVVFTNVPTTQGGNNFRTISSPTSGNGNFSTRDAGVHNHNVSGNTQGSGGSETRPVSYGVNYIIKL